MEGLSAIQTNHLRHLKGYIEAQTKFYANCHQIMQDLNRELANTTVLSEGETGIPILRPGVAAPRYFDSNTFGKRKWQLIEDFFVFLGHRKNHPTPTRQLQTTTSPCLHPQTPMAAPMLPCSRLIWPRLHHHPCRQT